MLCGAAKVSINPPTGTLMAGYMTIRRCVGIHDAIQAKVIVIRESDTTVLLISLDLVAVDKHYVNDLRTKIFESFDIPKSHIMIHATHTHSGPGGTIREDVPVWEAFQVLWAPYNRTMIEDQHRRILSAIDEAMRSMEECEVSLARDQVLRIASNRLSPEKEYVPELNVLQFKKRSGKRILAYHFACHPTVLHADNLYISADFPGVSSAYLERQDDVELAVFLNGPSGDVSTRFTRRQTGFDEAERLGKILGHNVSNLLDQGSKIPGEVLKVELSKLLVQSREFVEDISMLNKLAHLRETVSQLRSAGQVTAETRKLETEIEGLTALIDLTNRGLGLWSIETEVQVIRIGGICIVGVPGELFHQTGKEIATNFPYIPSLVLGNTNDYIGYIVPTEYYGQAGYEMSMTLLRPGTAELLRDCVVSTVRATVY